MGIVWYWSAMDVTGVDIPVEGVNVDETEEVM